MKKVVLLGMATMIAFQFSIANAAAVRAVDVRSKIVEDNKRALDKSALDGIVDSTSIAGKTEVSNRLVGVARNADMKEMSEALKKSFDVSEGGQTTKVSMMDIGRKLLMAKQSLSKMNRNDLDSAGQAHFDQLTKALEVSAQFMTLAAKDSAADTGLNLQAKKESDAFNKQLSIIPKLLSMDTREVKSHVDVMEAAINAKTSANMPGSEAYVAALKAKYGAKFSEKLDEILGCI